MAATVKIAAGLSGDGVCPDVDASGNVLLASIRDGVGTCTHISYLVDMVLRAFGVNSHIETSIDNAHTWVEAIDGAVIFDISSRFKIAELHEPAFPGFAGKVEGSACVGFDHCRGCRRSASAVKIVSVETFLKVVREHKTVDKISLELVFSEARTIDILDQYVKAGRVVKKEHGVYDVDDNKVVPFFFPVYIYISTLTETGNVSHRSTNNQRCRLLAVRSPTGLSPSFLSILLS